MTGSQALLGSHASVRQNLAAKRPGAADRSGERHRLWPIGVWVRLLRDTSRYRATKRSIAVRVKPPRNTWPGHSYYPSGGSDRRPADA
jgi:hypothetical protein